MDGSRFRHSTPTGTKEFSMSTRAITCLLSLIVGTLSVAVATAREPSPPGRVLHVSPQPLTSVDGKLQFTTIGAAAKAVEPGDRVCIHAGVYRESVVIEKSGTKERPIRFEAEPAARVVITGADVLSPWRKEADPGPEKLYSADWPHAFLAGPTHAHPDDPYHLLIGRVEQVFVQGYPLHQVLRRSELSRGSFWVDGEHQRLYAESSGSEDLNGLHVEASVRPVLWQCKGDDVQVRGVRFRYAANAAQEGAAQFYGRGDAVEDCVFERTNGVGASFFGAEQTVRRCTFQDNGQMGFSVVGARDLLMSGCLTRNNNTKNFARGWEAGGDKVVSSRRVTIEKSRFVDNRGSGLWFDIGNEACTVRNCLIADNEDAGIFYEISYGLHAEDNIITGNGFAETPGAWGAEAGIALSSSPECVIERNLVVGNKEGFDFREQLRTTPRIGQPPGKADEKVWNHDEVLRANVFADNRDAQLWGWFDVPDERLWPKAMQTGGSPGKDASLSLEGLRLVTEDNLYTTRDGEGLFHWGTEWRHHEYFTSLDAVREKLSLEKGSVAAPFLFADYPTHDFRVPADSAALKLGAYPRGSVPDCRLGTMPPADSPDEEGR